MQLTTCIGTARDTCEQCLPLGKEYSRKVNLNTQSSTETELVRGDMYMLEIMWLLYFIQSQGYNADHIELHQDTTSTQLLMKNGKF
jgi:hypothetical protein